MSEKITDNKARAERLIVELRPEASIRWIGSGDVNDVALVGEHEAFRFPKSDGSKRLLRYEFDVLEMVQGKTTLATAHAIYLDDRARFSVLSFVPGHEMKNREIAALEEPAQQEIGRKIGQFIKEFSTAVSLAKIEEIGHQLPQKFESHDKWYEEMYRLGERNASDYFAEYKRQKEFLAKAHPQGFDERNMAIHGDLHAANFVFADDDTLVGVIDFGDAGAGNIYRELRPLYSISETVFTSILAELGDTLGEIDAQVVRAYAIMNELGILIDSEQRGTFGVHRAEVAGILLDKWLGQDWITRRR